MGPIVECPAGLIYELKDLAAGETARDIVVGFVAGLLKFDESFGQRNERRLQGQAVQPRKEFRRYATVGELLRDSLHVPVRVGAGQAAAESGPVAGAGNHKPGGFVDQHVKDGVIGRGNRAAQAGLFGLFRLLPGEVPGLGQEIGMEAHANCAISEAARKRT